MAKWVRTVDLNSSTYSCFERNSRPVVSDLPLTSSFLNDSQERKPIIEITLDENDEQESSYPQVTSVGADEKDEIDEAVSGDIDHECECRVCDKKFTTKYSLAGHMNPNTDLTFPCRICQHPFKHKGNSKSHEYTHMNRKELKSLNIFHAQCTPCLLVFFNRSNYEMHMNMHKNIKPLRCQECNKQFVTKRTLNGHLLSQHGDEETKNKLRDSWKFQCTFPNCAAKFPSKSHLDTHRHSHSTKKQFKCTKCDKYYQTPKSRNEHAKVHKSDSTRIRSKCHFCQKNFLTTQSLNSHMKTHQELEFRCQICSKEFITKQNLNDHMTGVHEGRRPHPCPHCPNTFLRPSDLNKHFMRLHKKLVNSNK